MIPSRINSIECIKQEKRDGNRVDTTGKKSILHEFVQKRGLHTNSACRSNERKKKQDESERKASQLAFEGKDENRRVFFIAFFAFVFCWKKNLSKWHVKTFPSKIHSKSIPINK